MLLAHAASWASASPPSTRWAIRSTAEPEQYDSTWPRPVQAPWHGSPSSTITMWPSSAQAAVEPAAGHDAAADAGAERQQHELAHALARADAVLGQRGRARVVVDGHRQAEPFAHLGRGTRGRAAGCSRRRERRRCAGRRAPERRSRPPRRRRPCSSRTISTIAAEQGFLRLERRRAVERALDGAVLGHETRRDLRPAQIDPDDARAGQGGGYPTSPDGAGRKALPRLSRRSGQGEGSRRPSAGASRAGTEARPPKPPRATSTNGGGAGRRRRLRLPRLRRPKWRRVIVLGILVLFALVVVWAVTGYLSVRNGVKAANKRVQPGTRAALTKQDGLLVSHPTTILLLGTDSAPTKGRAGLRHSDSIMLVRTDPSHHRISYLSIPRDLYVPVAGLGQAKINAAYQAGGAPLAIRTIREYTGLKINHVVDRRLLALRGPDRRRGRDRRSTCRSRSSPTSSTARTTRSAARAGTAGASRRASSTWTGTARSSTRASARTGSTRARATSRAARGSRP